MKSVKNITLKILALAICCIVSFMATFVSTPKSQTALAESQNNTYTVQETGIPFVSNGKTDYVLMVSDQATEREIYAVRELQTYLSLATNVTFTIVKESQLSSGASFISVGETQSLKANVFYDKDELGPSGFVIKTQGKNVYIVGGADLGTIYGAYEFLGIQVGYEYYSYDCIVYDTVTEANIKKCDVVKIPAFKYRLVLEGTIWRYDDRMWQYGYDLPYVANDHSSHNSTSIVSKDKYLEEHPNWFSGSRQQLCYSSGEEYVDIVCDYYKKQLLEYDESGKVLIFFGQMDAGGYCTCDKCNAAVAKYGNITATMIQFFNLLSDRMQPWIDENMPEREVIFAFFAYQWSQYAPVAYDENTKTYSFSEDVRMNDNVGVLVAPIYMDFYIPYSHPNNAVEKQCLESWNQITDHLMYYGYDSSFAQMMYDLNTFNKRIEDYKWLYELGVEYVLEQKPVWTSDSWQCWAAYRYFTEAEMMWNPYADFNALTEEFFRAYYKEGADAMLSYFNEWRRHWEVIYTRYETNGQTFIELDDTRYWPMTLLDRWLKYTDEALVQIERYKHIDVDTYNAVYNHIEQERIRLEYQLIDLYGSVYFTQAGLVEAKQRVWKGMSKYGMMTSETNNVTTHLQTLKEKWGIK